MACAYNDLSFHNKDSLTHKDLLTPGDLQFLNALYFGPVSMVLQMDKELLHHYLTKARLVCRWLEGILKFTDKLEGTHSNKEGK